MPDSIFLLPVAAALVELTCSGLWVSWYFRLGIPIFRRRALLPDGVGDLDVSIFAEGYAEGKGAPILLHALGPTKVAFREKIVALAHFTPVMRGLIRLEPETRSFSTSGHVNLFPIAFLVTWPWLLISAVPEVTIVHMAFMAFPLVIMGWIYVTQASRFAKLHDAVLKSLERAARREHPRGPSSDER